MLVFFQTLACILSTVVVPTTTCADSSRDVCRHERLTFALTQTSAIDDESARAISQQGTPTEHAFRQDNGRPSGHDFRLSTGAASFEQTYLTKHCRLPSCGVHHVVSWMALVGLSVQVLFCVWRN